MSRTKVDGIILIISCQKHKDTRLKRFALSKSWYNNYKVVYVIGDFFQPEPYKMEGDYMYLKCEDSYVHLLKKVALSMKYLREIYEIKEGFLRCGDDLEFNEDNLIKFIEGPKFDYYGQSWHKKNIKITNPEVMKPPIRDMFMASYFRSHPEDLKNPQFNLQNVNMDKYVTRPNIPTYASGVIFYLSMKAVDVLLTHFEAIHMNVFHHDTFTNSTPYIWEDCGIAYIMYYNGIEFTDGQMFWCGVDGVYRANAKSHFIVYHTNMNK